MFCPHAWQAAGKPCKNGSHFVHDGGSFGQLGDPVADTWCSFTIYNRWDATHREYPLTWYSSWERKHRKQALKLKEQAQFRNRNKG